MTDNHETSHCSKNSVTKPQSEYHSTGNTWDEDKEDYS